jgi:hypothetical protein
MYAKIGNKIIDAPMEKILNDARLEASNGKLKVIEDKGRNILITCPMHKNGMESRPSCNVLNVDDDPKYPKGTTFCYTCGYKVDLPQLIADIFDRDVTFGEDWLLSHYCNTFIEKEIILPEFEEQVEVEPTTIDENILLSYDYYHPYMWQRKLSKSVVDEFRVGYDKERDAITFPVYDERHRLVMVTARNVQTKKFHIPKDVKKPVYLLYDILQRGVTKVFVCESQINTLYLRSLGYDSIGLFGTGSANQLETLKKSGIREYILCFDGDEAGRKGAHKFKKALGNSVFITDLRIPWGKDVNDLTAEQFEKILVTS